jgi:hypothetical protein
MQILLLGYLTKEVLQRLRKSRMRLRDNFGLRALLVLGGVYRVFFKRYFHGIRLKRLRIIAKNWSEMGTWPVFQSVTSRVQFPCATIRPHNSIWISSVTVFKMDVYVEDMSRIVLIGFIGGAFAVSGLYILVLLLVIQALNQIWGSKKTCWPAFGFEPRHFHVWDKALSHPAFLVFIFLLVYQMQVMSSHW